MDYSFPNQPTYAAEQILRAEAALPAAGAWDATPLERTSPTFDSFTLFFKYTRGAAGGGFDFKVEFSLDGTDWYQSSILAPGLVAPGADITSEFQRELFTYTSQGAAAEFVAFGPIHINGAFDQIRVSARESGVVGTPGDLSVLVSLK